jgi:hypothetical protein
MVGLRCRAAQISQGGAAAPPYHKNKKGTKNFSSRLFNLA